MVISQHMTDTHTVTHTTGTPTLKDRALQAIAILGLIALLLLGAWGIIQIAFTLYGFLGNSAPSSLSTTSKTEQVVTTSANANTTTQPAQNLSTGSGEPRKASPSAGGSASSYVPAKAAARTLYGAPDLSVSIGSVTNLGGGRYSAQFTIQNVGTNATPYGWTFNASLPTSPTYTYASNQQQALNPGDKVVYTLGFSNVESGYSYNYYGYNTYPYPANCGYTANYTYNGVYSYPGASYTCNTNNNYNGNTYYNYGSKIVTVSVDPYNYIGESSEANNTASAVAY